MNQRMFSASWERGMRRFTRPDQRRRSATVAATSTTAASTSWLSR